MKSVIKLDKGIVFVTIEGSQEELFGAVIQLGKTLPGVTVEYGSVKKSSAEGEPRRKYNRRPMVFKRSAWSEEEDKLIVDLASAGKHAKQISKVIENRTIGAVYTRMSILRSEGKLAPAERTMLKRLSSGSPDFNPSLTEDHA